MTIITEKHKKWPQYFKLHQCGQVTISKDYQKMGLNCLFCSIITTTLEDFNRHIQEHSTKIDELYAADAVLDEKEDISDYIKNIENNVAIEEIAIKVEPSLISQEIFYAEEPSFCDVEDYDPFKESNSVNINSLENLETWQEPQTLVKSEESTVDQNENVSSSEESQQSDMDQPCSSSAKTLKSSKVKIKNEKKKSCKIKEENTESEESCSEISDGDFANSSRGIDDADSEMEEITEKSEISTEQKPATTKKKYTTAPKIDINDPKNQAIIVDIIKFYEQNPYLWKTNSPEYGKIVNNPTLEQLCLDIKNKYQQEINAKQIKRTFISLRGHFFAEKKVIQKSKKEPSLWYYKHLTFLLNNKPFKAASPEDLLQIASHMEQFPILWNVNDVEHRHKSNQDKSLEQLKTLLNLSYHIKELQTNIAHMLREYSKDKEKRINCQRNHTEFTPDNPALFEKLQFLDACIRPFECRFENCTELLETHDEYLKHVAKHEGREFPYGCQYCSMFYKTFGGLELHVRRHHTGYKPFPCEFCEKAFHSKSEYNQHLNNHSESDKKYVCYLCGKAFHTKPYLTKHLRRHTSKFQCPMCPKTYSEEYRLKAHINSHNKIRAFVCDVCGKGFYSQHTMGQHKKLHSDVENYQCNLCGRRFKQVSAMHSHKKWFHQRLNANE